MEIEREREEREKERGREREREREKERGREREGEKEGADYRLIHQTNSLLPHAVLKTTAGQNEPKPNSQQSVNNLKEKKK